MIARSIDTQIWILPACTVQRELIKGMMASANTSVLGKATPPCLTLMPDSSILPCMSLVLFALLPQHWKSEGVSQNMSLQGPFQSNIGAPEALCLTQSQSLLVFTARSYETFLPGTETLGWGPAVGLGHLVPHGRPPKSR